jgi:hypothetical protein
MTGKRKPQIKTFKTALKTSIPTGRNGKHKSIVTQILSDLKELSNDECLKIPLSELPDTKVNIRSALNRAAHKLQKSVSTAADEDFLYVWNS